MASKKVSKDQKRKVKLAEKDKRSRAREMFQPYAGNKYRSDFWTPVLFATEQAIHDVILESNRTLTNNQVKQAMTLLIDHLRRGGPVALGNDEAEVHYSPAGVVERLFYRIRKAWRELADRGRTVSAIDMTGVLRTLLGSVETRGLQTGSSRGYVSFLEDFIPQCSRTLLRDSYESVDELVGDLKAIGADETNIVNITEVEE